MDLFIFILLGYGITNILVFGSIFDFWRNFWNKINPNFFGKLFSCPMCLSTWVGFILSFMFNILSVYTPMASYGLDIIPLIVFLDGCLMSGGVWLIHTVQEYFE